MEFAKRTELRIRRQANETFVLHVNNVEAARGSPLPQKKISRKTKKAGVPSRFSVYSFTIAYLLFTSSFPNVQQPRGAE